jgi:integrase
VGQRDPFSIAEVNRIRKQLRRRGEAGRRDLALFSTAIDTMLRTPDLLGLLVKDVRKRDGAMRDTFKLAASDVGQRSIGIQCTLSKTTMKVLDQWISQAGKKQGDYLFTGQIGGGQIALSSRQLSRLVKAWAVGIGLDEHLYGIESLRRTRAIQILDRTGNLEVLRELLGHTAVTKTALYLRDASSVDE